MTPARSRGLGGDGRPRLADLTWHGDEAGGGAGSAATAPCAPPRLPAPALWDTHCHLADPVFAPDRGEVLVRARAAGVGTIVVVAAGPAAWGPACRLVAGVAAGDPGGRVMTDGPAVAPHGTRARLVGSDGLTTPAGAVGGRLESSAWTVLDGTADAPAPPDVSAGTSVDVRGAGEVRSAGVPTSAGRPRPPRDAGDHVVSAVLPGAAGSPGGPDAPALLLAAGVHPHEAATVEPAAWSELEEILKTRAAVALGEIGLDYHYDFAPRPVQRQVFARQLEMAAALRLPVVLHVREAAEDLLDVMRVTGVPPRGGIWHCFAEGPDQAEAALAIGLHLGFGGVVTFPKGTEGVRAAARMCPRDRLLLETDSPYLAPAPRRGRRNEPARVADVAAFLATLRGEPLAELCATSSACAAALLRPRLPGAPIVGRRPEAAGGGSG